MKSLKRCQNGHYFDSNKHSACPFCGIQELDGEIKKTMAKRSNSSGGDMPEGSSIPVTMPRKPGGGGMGNMPGGKGEARTVGVFKRKIGIDPVVGWLVAIEGPEKGRDYRLAVEKNFIGRAESMDITIADETISRENHAIVSYNPKKHIFRLYPGDSRRLVYLNDDEVIQPQELNPYDIIELGDTKLIFMSLCSERFNWENKQQKEKID